MTFSGQSDPVVHTYMPWNSVLSPLTHTWKRSGKGWCAINGKTYGGLLSNTYKFAPRKVQQPRDFDSSGALFGIGTEKLSKKKTLAKMLRLGVFQLRLDCAIGLDHLL